MEADGIRRGSVLLLVLVVLAMLTLGTATYLELMQNEQRAVRHHGRGIQATRLAESGVEYVKSVVALSPAEIQQKGGLMSNPALMQGVIADDQIDDFDRGRFTIVTPAQSDGLYSGIRYGLENECAKLNINTLLAVEDTAQARLLALPGMTAELADAILDWLDQDDEPRSNGAEVQVYAQLTPPYAPRNGAIADLDELLLVRGVTPELLYGLDQNRNYAVESQEQPRGVLVELDNADGSLNRGWAAYLTVSSAESMQPPPGKKLIDLNSPDLQQLYTDLNGVVGDDKAKFIIAYRQYGPMQQQQPGQQPGGAPGQGGQAGQAGSPQNNAGSNQNNSNNGGNNGNGSNGGNNGNNNNANPQIPPITVQAAQLQLKFDQQGGTQINSPLDLVGARVQIPPPNPNGQPAGGQPNNGQAGGGQQGDGSGQNSGGQNNGPALNGPPNTQPAQNVDSPWPDTQTAYRELLKLYDVVSPGSARRVAGRVNINAATRPVLQSIPGLPAAAVGKIVSRRELEPDMALSDQRNSIWMLIEGIVTLAEMKELEKYVTTRGDVFSGQSVGFFDAGPIAARVEFIVDRSGTTPHLRALRDLSPLGRGFSTAALGVEAAEKR